MPDPSIENLAGEFRNNLSNALDQYIADIQNKTGTEEEILKQLLDEIENETGDFKKLMGSMGSAIDQNVFMTSGAVSNLMVAGLADLYRWEYETTAEHCETCKHFNGKTYTWDEWTSGMIDSQGYKLGLPGENTDCSVYCRCTLIPIPTP